MSSCFQLFRVWLGFFSLLQMGSFGGKKRERMKKKKGHIHLALKML